MCWEAPGTHTCPLCGRRVCDRHWRGGHCEVCDATLCELCRSSLSVGYCAVCGRLVCESCSIEVGAARLCRECARRARRA